MKRSIFHTFLATSFFLLATLILPIALSAPAAAGPYEDGLAAYQKGDYATALGLWRRLADQGMAEAQYNLGIMHENGEGVPQDDAEAVKWQAVQPPGLVRCIAMASQTLALTVRSKEQSVFAQ